MFVDWEEFDALEEFGQKLDKCTTEQDIRSVRVPKRLWPGAGRPLGTLTSQERNILALKLEVMYVYHKLLSASLKLCKPYRPRSKVTAEPKKKTTSNK